MPKLGETMEDGTIVKYMVNVGDMVEKGAPLFEVETDKAVLEVESPAQGYVRRIVARCGATLDIGELVLVLGEPGEEIADDSDSSEDADRPSDASASVSETDASDSTTAELPELTSQQGFDDLKLGQTVRLSSLQKITGRRMLQSKAEIPCFYLSADVDVTCICEMSEQLAAAGKGEPVCRDFIVFALVVGLTKFPIMTGKLDGDNVVLADSIDIGIAVDVPGGIVAPLIRDLAGKTLLEISAESGAIVNKAQQHKLTPDDLGDGCITVSDLGGYGVRSNTPIVAPGQCSILGMGRVTDTCMPANPRNRDTDGPDYMVRKIMSLTLSVDHRIANGTYAAQFIDFVRKYVEDASNFG